MRCESPCLRSLSRVSSITFFWHPNIPSTAYRCPRDVIEDDPATVRVIQPSLIRVEGPWQKRIWDWGGRRTETVATWVVAAQVWMSIYGNLRKKRSSREEKNGGVKSSIFMFYVSQCSEGEGAPLVCANYKYMFHVCFSLLPWDKLILFWWQSNAGTNNWSNFLLFDYARDLDFGPTLGSGNLVF